MSFAVAPDAYDRFMGRYSSPLAPAFADFAKIGGVGSGQRVLDVGCGPGALTTELVRRLGPGGVAAVDPSESFVTAAQDRHPAVTVQRATAEHLPFKADEFDATVAQLVVQFMTDPVAGLREMTRVTRPGGVVAACVWDHGGGTGPLSLFWAAARRVDADVDDESGRAGTREGHLAELFDRAGLRGIEATSLSVPVEHATFDEWWEPFTLGVGPAGTFVAGLDEARRTQLRGHCQELLPAAPFVVDAHAWAALGHADQPGQTK